MMGKDGLQILANAKTLETLALLLDAIRLTLSNLAPDMEEMAQRRARAIAGQYARQYVCSK